MKWSNEDAKWKVKMDNRKNSQIQPGFCIVQNPGTLASQAQEIFQGRNHDAAKLFMQLNGNTQWVKPGQMLIIADPNNNNQNHQISKMQEAKRKVDSSLATANMSTAKFIHQNYANIAVLTSYGDTLTGLVSDTGERYFTKIEGILKRIEASYQNQFRTQGTLISQQFFAERRVLFSELKPLLNKVSRLSLSMPKYESLKSSLGLSSRSIMHHWETAGVGAIKGYSNYIERAAKSAKFMKAGGWVALGFSFLNTSNTVFDACYTGREKECSKTAIKEYSSFTGSTLGGVGGGIAASAATAPLCLAIGAATYGIGGIVCGVVSAAGGSYAGGTVGEKIGGKVGDGVNYILFKGD